MRLWHKDLIDVLPDKQLISTWRECCAIIKNIETKGTPNHLLVNPVIDYNLGHFLYYASMIADEMEKRNFNIKFYIFEKTYEKLNAKHEIIPTYEEMFADWHNQRYLVQCYCNLQEKFDRGGISEKEWKKIYNKYKKLIKNRYLLNE